MPSLDLAATHELTMYDENGVMSTLLRNFIVSHEQHRHVIDLRRVCSESQGSVKNQPGTDSGAGDGSEFYY